MWNILPPGGIRLPNPFSWRVLPVALFIGVLVASLAAPYTHAAEPGVSPWQAVITSHSVAPPYLIAVDKSRQQLSFFERRSPLRLSRKFFCTTGQAVGDKILQGDLKTPEGIYFVVQRIGSGLDFIKYGNEAYTLNYPNPVDRLRRKTGYGIWIHGRGEPLVPLQTEGCVSMDNGDLALLGRLLVPGTPVALTESFAFVPEEDPDQVAVAEHLKEQVRGWSDAWSARSHEYFDYYDAQAYGLAQGEPFSAFRAQKERLFKQLPWIKSTVRDIQALQGPGYWVTWFYQDYQAPNLSTRGVRRLYWADNGKGEFRILGMEWHPGMTTSTLLASADPLLPQLEAGAVPKAPSGWETGEQGTGSYGVVAAAEGRLPVRPVQPPAPADAPATLPDDTPGNTGELVAMGGPGKNAGSDATPRDIDPNAATPASAPSDSPALPDASSASDVPVKRNTENSSDMPPSVAPASTMPPTAPVAASGAAAASTIVAMAGSGNQAASPDHVETAASGRMARPSPEAFRLAERERERIKAAEAAKEPPASVGRAASDLSLPPALPAQGLAASPQASAAGGAQAGSEALARAGEPAAAKGRNLPESGLETSSESGPKSAPESNSESELKTEKPPLPSAFAALPDTATASRDAGAEDPQIGIRRLVESWRKAWEAGDLDAYMACYAPKARQGSRKSANAIRKQKEQLWKRAEPASVVLEDLRVTAKGNSAQVSMRQVYADARGKGDTGLKTLILDLKDGAWLIKQEDWSALPDETRN